MTILIRSSKLNKETGILLLFRMVRQMFWLTLNSTRHRCLVQTLSFSTSLKVKSWSLRMWTKRISAPSYSAITAMLRLCRSLINLSRLSLTSKLPMFVKNWVSQTSFNLITEKTLMWVKWKFMLSLATKIKVKSTENTIAPLDYSCLSTFLTSLKIGRMAMCFQSKTRTFFLSLTATPAWNSNHTLINWAKFNQLYSRCHLWKRSSSPSRFFLQKLTKFLRMCQVFKRSMICQTSREASWRTPSQETKK